MLTSMGDVMREAYRRGWITTRDGNISIRRGNKFYITPSGVRKSIIVPEMIVRGKVCGSLVEFEDANPSGELEMHQKLQLVNFRGIRAVVHLHPTHILAAIYRGIDLQKLAAQFPEINRYTKVGPLVPSVPATSLELAEETFKALTLDGKIAYDIVGQANHGVCAIGESPWEAFEHIERLEHICEIVVKSNV
jgi:L-fuculose-phosphate aldolase